MSDEPTVAEEANTAIGPGTFEIQTAEPGSTLDDSNEYEYVELLNPLSQDFIAVFGITREANAPIRVSVSSQGPEAMSKSESDIQRNYGLNLRNADHKGKVHISNKVRIPSGKTVRLFGNEAQVVIKQLTNEIMSREGHKSSLGDPYQRRLVEQRIIQRRGSVNDFMNTPVVSEKEQLKAAMEQQDEQAFPTVTAGTQETGNSGSSGSNQTEPPAKGNSNFGSKK